MVQALNFLANLASVPQGSMTFFALVTGIVQVAPVFVTGLTVKLLFPDCFTGSKAFVVQVEKSLQPGFKRES